MNASGKTSVRHMLARLDSLLVAFTRACEELDAADRAFERKAAAADGTNSDEHASLIAEMERAHAGLVALERRALRIGGLFAMLSGRIVARIDAAPPPPGRRG